ncbi:MAG: hypothetical protein QW607_11580 [Desulfurococcaceae archaeon]
MERVEEVEKKFYEVIEKKYGKETEKVVRSYIEEKDELKKMKLSLFLIKSELSNEELIFTDLLTKLKNRLQMSKLETNLFFTIAREIEKLRENLEEDKQKERKILFSIPTPAPAPTPTPTPTPRK